MGGQDLRSGGGGGGNSFCAAGEQGREPSSWRDRGLRQGTGTRDKATADIQTGQSLGRQIRNTPNILVLLIAPWGALEKHDIFLKR